MPQCDPRGRCIIRSGVGESGGSAFLSLFGTSMMIKGNYILGESDFIQKNNVLFPICGRFNVVYFTKEGCYL